MESYLTGLVTEGVCLDKPTSYVMAVLESLHFRDAAQIEGAIEPKSLRPSAHRGLLPFDPQMSQ